MNRRQRLSVGFVVILVALVWAGIQHVNSSRRLGWQRLVKEGNVAAALRDQAVPGTVASQRRAARFFMSERFPPDLREADEHLIEALELAPFRSEVWMDIARLRIYEHRPAASRAAIGMADRFDPGYPAQRLQAARLWLLLGERERAFDLARHVADMDDQGLIEAAVSLRDIDIPPVEIWQRLGPGLEHQDDARALFKAIASPRIDDMEALWSVMPVSRIVADESLRNAAAEAFSRPLVWEAVEPLWSEAYHDLERISLPEGNVPDTVLLADPDLTEGPVASGFPWGWRDHPASTRVHSSFRLRQDGDSQGVATLRMIADDAASGITSWVFYCLPLPPTQCDLLFSIAVREISSSRSTAALGARVDGVPGLRGESHALAEDLWQDLELTVPASDRASLVQLRLFRHRRDSPDSMEATLQVRDLSVRVGHP